MAAKRVPGRCEVCGDPLPWTRMGRPPKYCARCRKGVERARNLAHYRDLKRKHAEPKPMRHEDAIDTILEVLAR